jgi:hypothetical protein
MKIWTILLSFLFLFNYQSFAAESYGTQISYDRTTGGINPGAQGFYNHPGIRKRSLFLTGTTPTISWKTNEYAIVLSGNTTYTFSNIPTDTNVVTTVRVLVVGNGSYTFNNSGDSISYLTPMFTPKNGTNEYIFQWNLGNITARMEKPVEFASYTIIDPDGAQAIADAIPLLVVESTWAPNGITIANIYLKTDAASTYSLSLEEWTAMVSPTTTTIETVATSSSSEATDDGSLSDSTVAAGSIIFANLPTTTANFITISFTYRVNP